MSSKPVISLARWADLVGSFVTAPSSGLRDTGFVDGTPADADIVNYEINQLYKWALYLSDGALSGDVSIAGSLSVTDQSLAFTDFTFTADPTTDLLHAVANGRLAGDGPLQLTNSGGALPGGLAAVTDYYWIPVDADHGYLATTRTRALAAWPIDITSAGTGTHTLRHQAGTTRVGVLATTGQISQATQILAVPHYPPSDGTFAFGDVGIPAGTVNTRGWFSPIHGVPAGRRITTVRARVTDDGVGDKLLVVLALYDPGFGTGAHPRGDGQPPVEQTVDVAGTASAPSTGSGVVETIQATGFSALVVPGVTYLVCVRKFNGAGAAGRMEHCEIEFV